MRASPEALNAVRQQCRGLSSSVRRLALLALLLGGSGCVPSHWECVDSDDCAPGLTCMHWEPGEPEEERSCVKACPVEAETCDTGEACSCPDSPAKARCFDDDGKRIGVCERR